MGDAHPTTVNESGCALCGLALPRHAVIGGDGKPYCCQGCAHVATILETMGRENEEARLRIEAAREGGILSAVAPNKPAIDIPSDRREEMRCGVEGMACPSCAWLVEALLARQPGVGEVEIDFVTDTARVVFDLTKTSRDAIEENVARSGYRLVPFGTERNREDRRDLIRLGVAAFIAMNQMSLAFIGYDLFFSGAKAGTHLPIIGWMQILLSLPVIGWAALPLYRRAWAALRNGRAVMETLLSLGVLSAFGLSVWVMLSGDVHLYMETATMLVTISLAGRVLERWIKQRASRSLAGILQFSPTKARRAEDGRFAPLAEFEPGNAIRVESGEVVPIDLRAQTDVIVREGLLTGEPHPVGRGPGDVILAGSKLEKGELIGVVDRPAGETVADAIQNRVGDALRRIDTGSRLADRLAQGFVPLVLLVAIATVAGHLLQGAGLRPAAMAAVAVLVVACPCAFGVAASSAFSLALLRLAQDGILVKDPSAIEAARSIDMIIFDKTGTLTRGDLTLSRIGWLGDEQADLLAAVGALEEKSRHPVGLALARSLGDEAGPSIDSVVEVPGAGVTGQAGERRVAVGSLSLFRGDFTPTAPQPRPTETRVWFGYAGEPPAGYIDLGDSLKPEAREMIEECQSRGIETALFSGDSPSTTEAMAKEAGIAEAAGGLRPEEKAERVRALRASGRRILYVGDGFNDAEALAAADVGVALGAGADLALLSAPVVIAKSQLSAIKDFLNVAGRAGRIVRQNFAWAFGYNILLLPVAALGLLQPVYAAALMALSSTTVGVNSARLSGGAKSGKQTAEGWFGNELVRRPT